MLSSEVQENFLWPSERLERLAAARQASRAAAAAPTTIDDESILIESLYRLSVEAYHAMIRAGILTEDDSVELLDGLLVLKMAKNPPHVVATELLQRALSRVVPEGWYVSMQNPVTTQSSEPEPDGKVVKGDPRTYLKRKPGPRNVPIAIEVSDNSLRRDRTVKKAHLCRGGDPELLDHQSD